VRKNRKERGESEKNMKEREREKESEREGERDVIEKKKVFEQK